jgi:serine protease Do
MEFWKTAALSAALLGAAGAGAAMAPPAYGQSGSRVTAPRAVEMFSTGGSRIGVTVADVDATDAKTATGALIEAVEEGSPAEKAGLKKGDVVVEFDGERVRSVRQFTRLVSETPAGRQVAVAVMRDGRRMSVNVEPRESSPLRVFGDDSWQALEELRDYVRPMPVPAPAAPPAPPAPRRPPSPPRAARPPALEGFSWLSGNQLGVTVNGLSDQLKDYFAAKDGVLVTSVAEDSAAAKAGVKAGDVIVSVNGSTVADPGDLRVQMQRLGANQEFTLNIVRDKKPMTLKGKTEESRARRSTRRTIL